MRHILVIICYLYALTVSGQLSSSGKSNFEITKGYSIADGLSHNYVLRIREDFRGFLWMATMEGLNRFDGQEFKKYYHQRNNPNSLPGDMVWDILEYQPGMLLIATTNGLGVLNTFTGQFENDKIEFTPLKAGSNANVTKLERDPEGHIWVNHDGEMDLFDQDLNYLYRFTDLDWAKSIKGISMYLQDWVIDQNESIWIPSDTSGIIIIDIKAKRILSYKNNPDNLPYFSHKLIRSLMVDGDSILWVSQWGEGLMKYDIHTGKQLAKLFYEFEDSQNELLKTNYGTFLFSHLGYCYELDPHTLAYDRVFEYGKDEDSKDHISMGSISTCATNQNICWYGTAGGLFKLNSKIPKKEIILNIPDTRSVLMVSRSGLIYGTAGENTLFEIDMNKGIVEQYTVPAMMSLNHASYLSEDHSNNIWISSETGLRRYEPVNKKFDTPVFLPEQLKTGKIRANFCDRDGNLWITTEDPLRIFRISPLTNAIHIVPDSVLLPFTSTGALGQLNNIEEDKNGLLWMSSGVAGGLLCYDKAKNTWITYPTRARNKDVLSKIGINSIWPDTSGKVWLVKATFGGVVKYDYRRDSISIISKEDGLLSGDVRIICGDELGNLWISSPFGISRYEIANDQVTGHFTMDYGSSFNEYWIRFDPYSKNLMLQGQGKLILLNPEKMMDSLPPPRPILDGIIVNNDIIPLDPSNPAVNLNYKQKNISISFAAINFSNNEKLLFAYTLSGKDDEWTYTTIARNVQYSLLSPGEYSFKVKVNDGSGQWSDSYELLSFTIRPPFWRSYWFLSMMFLLIGFTVFLLYKRRIRSIRNQAELKTKIAETEMMALRAQMNPHFVFNCITSIDSLIQSNDKYNATLYLNKFAKLLRNILDSSKMNNMTLAKDLETLKLYIELEQFRNDHKFLVNIQVDPSLLQGDYKVPPLVIQPYVENAIIHGLRNRSDQGGNLKVDISKLDDYIQYIVEDNGVGRKNTLTSQTGDKRSYGMEMSSERIRLFNQEEYASVTITDLEEGGTPKGTKVVVRLKIV